MAFERSLPEGVEMRETLAWRSHDGVGELWLHRPTKLNATTDQMVHEIHDVLDTLVANPPRVLVLSGAGRAFCAGRDLGDSDPEHEDAYTILADVYNPLILRVAELEIVTVAAVHGAVMGTGLGLALACDLVVAAGSSRWGSPFGRIGAVADSGAHYFFRAAGIPKAFGLILLGDYLDGKGAFDYGLASKVIDDASFDAEVAELAIKIAHGPTLAFLSSKRILNRERVPQLREILELEAESQGLAASTRDYVTGIQAFVARTEPVFEGR